MDLIDDRAVITKTYLTGWFLVDLIAIIPIDLIFNVTGFTGLLRVIKIGKLSRLVKLTRLIRILKIMKEQSRILSYLSEFLSIGLGYERLFFFAMIFALFCHIGACLWIIQASVFQQEEEDLWKETWVEAGEF